MNQHTPGPILIRAARIECEAVAVGPYTPVVLQPYGPWIGGERGMLLGYPSETVAGRSCIVWDHRSSANTTSKVAA